MKRKLILSLAFLIFLLNKGFSQQCSGTCFETLIPYNLLKTLFGAKDFQGDKALWIPNFAEREKMTYQVTSEGQAFTRVDTTFFYNQAAGKYAITIFTTESSECNVCAPYISLAQFRQAEGGKWQLLNFDKLYRMHGEWGKKGAIDFGQITGKGNDLRVLRFGAQGVNQGISWSGFELILIARNFPSIFYTETHMDNTGAYGEDNELSMVRKTEVEYLPDSDLKVTVTENGKVKESLLYAYNREYQNTHGGQRYVRVGKSKVLPSTDPEKPKPAPVVVEETDMYFTYKVSDKGDNLSEIAHQHGTSIAAIMVLNDKKSDVIKIGEKLRVPKRKIGNNKIYVVTKKGDSLWAIGQKFGVPIEDIKLANGKQEDRISVGDMLQIPPKAK